MGALDEKRAENDRQKEENVPQPVDTDLPAPVFLFTDNRWRAAKNYVDRQDKMSEADSVTRRTRPASSG